MHLNTNLAAVQLYLMSAPSLITGVKTYFKFKWQKYLQKHFMSDIFQWNKHYVTDSVAVKLGLLLTKFVPHVTDGKAN